MYVNTIMESCDATFFENIFPMKDMHSTSKFSFELIPEPVLPVEFSEQPLEEIIEENDNESLRKTKGWKIVWW